MKLFEGLDLKGINPLWEKLAYEAETLKEEESLYKVKTIKKATSGTGLLTSTNDPDYVETANKMTKNKFYKNFFKEHN